MSDYPILTDADIGHVLRSIPDGAPYWVRNDASDVAHLVRRGGPPLDVFFCGMPHERATLVPFPLVTDVTIRSVTVMSRVRYLAYCAHCIRVAIGLQDTRGIYVVPNGEAARVTLANEIMLGTEDVK